VPSVEQMVNEVQGILRRVEANTAAAPSGLVNVSHGLATLVDRQQESISLLELNGAQNDAVIHRLGVLVELSRQQLQLLERQVEIDHSIERSVKRSLRIAELVHAAEALEVDRSYDSMDEEHEVADRRATPTAGDPEPSCGERRPAPYERKIASFEPLGSRGS